MNEIDKVKANNAVMALWDIISECLVGVQYNLYIIHEI